MANTNIRSLEVLNVNSVTALSSLFMFCNLDGVTRCIDGVELARLVGPTQGWSTYCMTNDIASITTGSAVFWDMTIDGDLGTLLPSSKSTWQANFDGWLQITATAAWSTALGDVAGIEIYQNGTFLQGTKGHIAGGAGPYPPINFKGGPVPVSSGDFFHCCLFHETSDPMYIYAKGTWIAFERIG